MRTEPLPGSWSTKAPSCCRPRRDLRHAVAVMAVTPSLIPRTWLFRGIVSGVSGAAVYGVGVLLGRLVRRSATGRRLAEGAAARSPGWVERTLWAVLAVAVPVTLVVALVAGARCSRSSRR